MPCNCNKEKKEADDKKECPEGQSFDVSQGKCVAKEAIGDPQAASTLPDPSSDGAGTGDKQEVKPKECPEGHSFNAESDMCEPTASDKTEQIGQTKTNIATEKVPAWATALQNKVDALSEKKPTAQVGLEDGVYSWKTIAEHMAPSLRKYGKYEFDITLDSLRGISVQTTKNSSGQVTESFRSVPAQLQEVVAITNTHATQDLDTDVAIVPGGISFRPVFQFAKTKRIDAGMDRARFFKTTVPVPLSQTVGTTATESTQTITAIEVTPSQITGNYLVGDFDEIENSPFDLLQAIVEGSAAAYEDFVATDMLDTESAEGTLSAGFWCSAETGLVITTSDTASITMDPAGVFGAREYLENQGYLRGGIKPVLFLHPQQWKELVTSTSVTSLATRSAPDIWIKAELENFAGVQIVVTNAVEHKTDQTVPAYNAIMCIPKHSYGIGIKRDVTVKMHEIGEDNEVRVNTTWRTKAGVIDETSIVRLSSTV